MKSLKSMIATGALAVAGAAIAQPAPPAEAPKQPTKADYIADINTAADMIQAGTAKYCKAEHDGDKSKDEYTNADVAALVRHWATLPDKNPNISLEAVHGIAVSLANDDITVCMDKRVKDLGPNNVPATGQQFMATHGIQAALYPAATTMSFNPKPVAGADSKDATAQALLYSFNSLGNYVHKLNEMAMMAQMGIPQAAQAVASFTSRPLLFLYNPAAPETSTSGPSLNAMHLFHNPVINVPTEGSAPDDAQHRPTSARPASRHLQNV